MSSHTYIHRGELQKRWMTSGEINNKQMVSVSIHHVFRSRLLDRIFFSLPRFCAFRKYYKRTKWSFLRYLSFRIVEGLKLTCVQYNVREVSSKFSTLLLSSVQKSERTKTRSIVQEFAVLRVNSYSVHPSTVGLTQKWWSVLHVSFFTCHTSCSHSKHTTLFQTSRQDYLIKSIP